MQAGTLSPEDIACIVYFSEPTWQLVCLRVAQVEEQQHRNTLTLGFSACTASTLTRLFSLVAHTANFVVHGSGAY